MVGPKSVQVRIKLVTWAPSNHKEGRNYTFWKTESQKYLMSNIWKYTTSTRRHDTKTQYLWQAGKKKGNDFEWKCRPTPRDKEH